MYVNFCQKISKKIQKLGTEPVLGFTFKEEPQAKKRRPLYDRTNQQRAFEATQWGVSAYRAAIGLFCLGSQFGLLMCSALINLRKLFFVILSNFIQFHKL